MGKTLGSIPLRGYEAYLKTLLASTGTDGATFTGPVVFSGTVDFNSVPTATVATDDKVLILDTSDSDATKTVTTQSIADLAGGGGGGLSDVVDDTTPQLGGNLDSNGFNITVDGGILTVDRVGDAAGALMGIDGDAGQIRQLRYNTAGVARWALLANAGAESGSDAGSNFELRRWQDDGTFIGVALAVNRATGGVNIYGNLDINGNNLDLDAGDITMGGGDIYTEQGRIYGYDSADYIYTATDGAFRFYTDSSETFRIGSANYSYNNFVVRDGYVFIDRKGDSATAQIYIDADSGYQSIIRFRGSSERWRIGKNATTESGSDAGSNFEIRAYDDTGTEIDTPIEITRVSGGAITFNRQLEADGGITLDNSVGINFGSQLGASETNLSKHLALYSTTWGINITSGAMNFVANGVRKAYFATTGLEMQDAISMNGNDLEMNAGRIYGFDTGDYIDFGTDNSIYFYNNGTVNTRMTGQDIRFSLPVKILERASAQTDTAAYGQIWVRNDTPNTLMFTDDAGNDHDLTASGGSFTANVGVFTHSGSTNITTTAATLALDTETLDPDSKYSISAGVITVTDAGYYNISYSVPINDDGTAGTTRGRIYAWVERDSGGGYAAITQSRAQDYAREASGGEGLSTSFLCQLTASDTIRVRIQSSSTVDVSSESGEAQLSIHRVAE